MNNPKNLSPSPTHEPVHDPVHWASIAQRRAADPARSVWVNASAGTGKTKVLVERVLRLMLPNETGQPGTEPHRILCLTYTKAAAAEMVERLLGRVSLWVTMPDHDLHDALYALFDAPPTDQQCTQARQLFSKLVDARDQLRIMTIHAFCQSVLARFPLEAGISPNFTLIEGAELADIFETARKNAMIKLIQSGQYQDDIQKISFYFSDTRLTEFIRSLWTEARQLTVSLKNIHGPARADAFRAMLGLSSDDTIEKWSERISDLSPHFIHDLILLSRGLADGIKVEQAIATRIADWLAVMPVDRAPSFDTLLPAFIKADGAPMSNGGHQGKRKKDDVLKNLYTACQQQVIALSDQRKMIHLLSANMSLFTLVDIVITEYERLKKSRGVLDFDDLIRKTIDLFKADADNTKQNAMPSWVMYKLDGGIDHILVDEAQDTNPEQWQIIAALTNTFDPHDSTRSRSLFIVGDQKQSIYRFQGADPDAFEKMLDHFGDANKSSESTLHLDRVLMNTSFRTSAPVLNLVDHIFSDPAAMRDLRLSESPTHIVSRTGQAGRVEVWSLIPVIAEKETPEPWVPPITIKPVIDNAQILSRRIAKQIRTWMDEKIILPSHAHPIEPRDIMILVRNRRPFLSALRAALRSENIPVTDSDRQPILSSLAALDILSLAQFALLPMDDYALACAIKSPFIGGNDDDLLTIAPMRNGSLWDEISKNNHYAPWRLYLEQLIIWAREKSIYHFFSAILDQPCPACPHGTGRQAYAQSNAADHAQGLDDLLSAALDASQSGTNLTHFIHELWRDNPEMRGSSGGAENAVRLMTVHGSKGLEAPIVILPDTIKSSRDSAPRSVFWPDDTGAPLPLWVPRSTDRPDDIPGVIERVKEAARAEEQRLLYVALTRAQDWLIIAGADKTQRATPSWHDTIVKGIEACSYLSDYRCDDTPFGPVHILESDQKAKPDRASRHRISPYSKTVPLELDSLIKKLKSPPVFEPAPLRPYRASGQGDKNNTLSPLDKIQNPAKFTRGLVTHKLLEILPLIPEDRRHKSADAYLKTYPDMIDQHDAIMNDVFGILNHPEFKFLFADGSNAEVPITGLLNDGRLIAGQIDRLYITPDTVYILDYKTGTRVPKNIHDIPIGYMRQMRTYRDLMQPIYPVHRIQCLLLYSFGAQMMDVTSAL